MSNARIIDGKAMAAELTASIEQRVRELATHGLQPGLSVVIVGDDPASQVYVRNKERTAERLGFQSQVIRLPADATQAELLATVSALNEDDSVHGILVQLPLPPQMDEQAVTQAISPSKDVDGFHYENVGKVNAGKACDAFVPCTPAGCMRMISDVRGQDLSGLVAVVIGRSNIVGKPLASLLLAANATVTVCHSRSPNLAAIAAGADILVAAVGRARMVTADFVKHGATVIDVGINRLPENTDGDGKSRLVGDVDFDAVVAKAGAITPVPGGVGPMTIAMLMANTLRAAERAR